MKKKQPRFLNGILHKQDFNFIAQLTHPVLSFMAENWNSGWMGQFMWGVFSDYLQLDGSNIIAMTPINFTDATNPKNPASVYKGSSSFTRCVWEVQRGNVVS